MSERIGIGLLGCGVVGSAVAQLLVDEQSNIEKRSGVGLDLRRVVVRNLATRRRAILPEGVLTDDPLSLFEDDGIQIVVELAGGTEGALDLTLAALAHGKNVVTANKAMVALHGPELFAAARRAGRCIAFEAAVAGGIPLIETVRRGLVANRIEAVYGILNGTCNFILTRMLENEASYAHALAEAQRRGYAEADPTMDVDGTDTAQKLVILASIALQQACELSRVQMSGITDVELIDLRAGRELGYVCKLLAIARQHEDGLDLLAGPTFIHESHPLANVSGPNNAISIYGHAVGHLQLYGAGAGGMPTASAVVSDIIDVATGNAKRTFDSFAVLPDQTESPICRPTGENVSRYYIRVGLADRPGGIGRVTTILGRAGINIAAVVQHDPHPCNDGGGDVVPVVVTTRNAKDRDVRASLLTMMESRAMVGRPVCIPVLEPPSE